MENKYISVTALNRYIAYKFDNDTNLHEVYLKGEISNFKYSGKHCYFSLKDQNSEISAMFFYPGNMSLKFDPKDGMSVQVVGKVQTYQKRGSYAIIVSQMQADGIGALYQEFLDTKEKLEKEGLFSDDLKMPLPEYPDVVAVITSPTGDAIHDIISTFNRRLPLAKIKLFPALVQGADAPNDLMKALSLVYNDSEVKALIIGRGGGSFEDLSCFNDEKLARMLAKSPIPTVSAIGHEADFTICDFVSSYRAPTPTGAAISLTKEKRDIIDILVGYSSRLTYSIKSKLTTEYKALQKIVTSYGMAHFEEILDNYQKNFDGFQRHLSLLSPENMLQKRELELVDFQKRIMVSYDNNILNITNRLAYLNRFETGYETLLKSKEHQFIQLLDKVVILNPFNIMKKGYSILYQDNHIVSSVKNLQRDKILKIKVSDGEVFAKAEKIVVEEEK